MYSVRFIIFISLLSFCADSPLFAQEKNGQSVKISFDKEVKPILAKHCFACHGPEKQESEIGFHEEKEAFRKGESGDYAIVPGDPEKSHLFHRIKSDDEDIKMPPEGKNLSSREIEIIHNWIQQGAKWEKHWAFEKLTRPDIPKVKNKNWVKNPVDEFILNKLEKEKLSPASPATKQKLIRRLYYDLTGLPPSYEQVQNFLADTSENAYEKLIDSLLASPHYGERWGRHWLDLVRFSETNGFERDGTKPNAWKYRDYVIKSFNDDKPYSQFIIEQLAGDELETITKETLTATGFYRLGIWDDEPADPALSLYNEYDDIVSTTGQVFMGLTINCARCHDHKIDPVPQEDYYKLLSFFRDIPTYGIRGNLIANNQKIVSPPKLIQKHQFLNSQKNQVVKKQKTIEDQAIEKMPSKYRQLIDSGGRKKVLKEHLKEFQTQEKWNEYSQLKSELEKIIGQIKKLPKLESVLSITNYLKSPEKTFVLLRGNPRSHGKEVQPGYPALFSVPDPVIKKPIQKIGSAGRRVVLANWIASEENFLTSRVIVNRVWQHHFGRGIVRSPNNFGQLGVPPTHPELLDWLAVEFMENGWRFKSLHKLILLSNTYQMSSEENDVAIKQDPLNNFFWRFNMRRLSAEELRDSILSATGQLNNKVYGSSFYPKLTDEVLQTQSQPGKGWGKSTPENSNRRSVYIFAKRSLVPPIMSVFDAPDQGSTCEARFITTQPGQALNLLNSNYIHEQALAFQKRVFEKEVTGWGNRIQFAIQCSLSRTATPEEITRGKKFILDLIKQSHLSEADAFKYYCLMLLNRNEFIYLD